MVEGRKRKKNEVESRVDEEKGLGGTGYEKRRSQGEREVFEGDMLRH